MSRCRKLEWLRFNKWEDVINDPKERYQFPCIYVVADKNRTPLYIGEATQKVRERNGKWWSGGLTARYYHDWTVLDACMDGTGRSIYIAKVKSRKDAEQIEAKLIYENKPRYNQNKKRTRPDFQLCLKHTGEFPKFEGS